MKRTALQTNFTAGEFTPRLAARIDYARYKNSVKTCTNAIVTSHGPLIRRSGWKYINDAYSNSDASRIIAFQVDSDESIALELNDQIIRFFSYNNGTPGIVTSGGSPVTVSTPYDVTDLAKLQFVQSGNTMYFAHPDYAPQQLTRTSNTVWTFSEIDFVVPATYEGGYSDSVELTLSATSGSGITVTAASSIFLAGDNGRQIFNTDGTGIAVITSITSGTVAVASVLETFDSTTVEADTWLLDISPLSTLTVSTTSSGAYVNVTSDIASFRTSDEGNFIHINDGVIEITEYASGSSVNGVIRKALSSEDESANWTMEMAAWNATRGYPRAVAMFEQRLWFASIAADPSLLVGSRTGLFTNFARGSDDSAGISFTLTLDKSSVINWMAASRELIIGGDAGESTVSGGNSGITPTNIQHKIRTYYGGLPRQVELLDNEVIFIQQAGRKIRGFRYDFQIDNYQGEELSFFSEHLGRAGIDQIAFAQNPYSILYAVLDTGDLMCGTIKRDQQVNGWFTIQTDGHINSVGVTSNMGESHVWACITRTVNGSSVNYIELLSPAEEVTDTTSYCDSYLTYSNPVTISSITKASPAVVTTSSAHGYSDGDTVVIKDVVGMTELEGKRYTVANKTSTTFELSGVNSTTYGTFTSGVVHKRVSSISGLDHLEGLEVCVVGDGAVQTNKTVASGAITLDTAAGEVVVGLGYTTEIVTQNLEIADVGAAQGNPTRWVNTILRVYQSGHPAVNGFTNPLREPSDYMDQNPAYTTGDLFYDGMEWFSDANLTITMTYPAPLTLLGIFGSGEFNVK